MRSAAELSDVSPDLINRVTEGPRRSAGIGTTGHSIRFIRWCFLTLCGLGTSRMLVAARLYGLDDEHGSNTIPVHVHHLRRKLLDAGATAEFVRCEAWGIS